MTIASFRMAVLAMTLAGVFSFMNSAHADKGKGHEKGQGGDRSYSERHDGDDDRTINWFNRDRRDDRVVIFIGDGDRHAITRYLNEDYHRRCPPGLAKKHNGCLPPGQAKKYRIGQNLPDDIVFIPVSDDLLGRLRPVPAGYQYVQVDKDILLIGEASKKVIDAVTLISAVGQ